MDLWTSCRVLLRRWRVLAVVACLALPAIAGTLKAVPPSYEARATLLLLIPAEVSSSEPDQKTVINPFLNFGSPLLVTARVMAEAMNQPEVAAGLERQGALASFEVTPDPFSQSPTLNFMAQSGNPKDATLTLQKVVEATTRGLSDRQQQAGAPEKSWITSQVVSAPEKTMVIRSKQVRSVFAILALLLALGIGLAFAAEARASRSAGRREPSLPIDGARPAEDDKIVGLRPRLAR